MDTVELNLAPSGRAWIESGLEGSKFTDKLAEIEPETRVVWIQNAPWNARTEYRLEPVDDHKSVIHMDFEANLSGWMRLMELVPDSMLTRIIRNDYRRLEHLLDEKSQSRPN